MDFGILGPVLVLDGGRVCKTTSMQRALLARLLVDANTTVSVDRLVDDVFGDEAPANPDAALQSHVSRLRKALSPEAGPSDVIVRRGRGYCIEIGADELDASRFERLAGAGRRELDDGDPASSVGLLGHALSLWRGPALADVTFASFAHGEAARLEELRLCAQEDHAAARLAMGAAREVAVDVEALVVEHPLRERLSSLLMVALARSGRQAEALRAYQRLRHMLDQELGLTPGPEVQELELAILRQDPGLGLPVGGRPGRPTWDVERRPAHNLPVVMSRFIGREAEWAELVSRIDTAAVVTLTGIGGAGKTRLALEVAARAEPPPPDGVWLVDLSRLTGADQVLPAVATALGVGEQRGATLSDAVVAAVRRSKLLLVLDGCEHFLAPVADLVAALVQASAGLRVLATSRVPLGLEAELVHPVPPLTVPALGEEATPEAIASSEAVRLFVDRAEQVCPGFVLDGDNAPAVAAICRRLDGIPLAIEMAAARLERLSVGQICAAIDDRFGLLAGAGRLIPIGQSTLVATLEWSHHLLSEPERTVLRRLSVFEGGATLAAAEHVCAGAGIEAQAVHGVLGRLVTATLVVADNAAREVRFRLLDAVRDYARDRLVESGEAAAVARSHAGWYLALAEAAEPLLEGRGQLPWLARLDSEHDNLRAALGSALAAGEVELALRLAGALTLFWHLRCCFGEGQAWLEAALDAGDAAPVLQAKAFLGAGWLCHMRGDDDAHAMASIDRAEGLYAALDDGRGVARSLLWLGSLLLHSPPGPEQARHLSDKSAAAAREVGDGWCLAMALAAAGWSEMHSGAARSANPLFEEALAAARLSGDRLGLELSLTGLGHAAMDTADNPAAERLLSEALIVARELGHAYVEANALSCLGQLAAEAADYGRAEVLLREGLAVSRRAGSDFPIGHSLYRLGRVALARNDLDAATAFFDEARGLAEQRGATDGAALLGLGEVYAAQGDTGQARAYLEKAHAVVEAKGVRDFVASVLHELGNLALRDGDHEGAVRLHGEALAHRSAVADLAGIGRSLGVIAALAMLDGKPGEAARLASAARNLRGSAPVPRWWSEQPLIEPVLRRVRDPLPAEAYEAACAEGTAMPVDEAVGCAQRFISNVSGAPAAAHRPPGGAPRPKSTHRR